MGFLKHRNTQNQNCIEDFRQICGEKSMKVKEDREIQRLNLKRKCYVILFKFVKCFFSGIKNF